MYYSLLFNDGYSDRSEVIAISKNKNKILEKLKEIKEEQNEDDISQFTGEELILNNDSWWYIDTFYENLDEDEKEETKEKYKVTMPIIATQTIKYQGVAYFDNQKQAEEFLEWIKDRNVTDVDFDEWEQIEILERDEDPIFEYDNAKIEKIN